MGGLSGPLEGEGFIENAREETGVVWGRQGLESFGDGLDFLYHWCGLQCKI